MNRRMTLKQYMSHKRALATTPFRIKPNGKAGYMVKGRMVPEHVFMDVHDTGSFDLNASKRLKPLNEI